MSAVLVVVVLGVAWADASKSSVAALHVATSSLLDLLGVQARHLCFVVLVRKRSEVLCRRGMVAMVVVLVVVVLVVVVVVVVVVMMVFVVAKAAAAAAAAVASGGSSDGGRTMVVGRWWRR